MATYTIIGGDQKEYSSVTADTIRSWIAQGRLNAQSLMREETDTEFRSLSTFPEFADALAAKAPAPGAPLTLTAPADWLERDYDFDLGGCISQGWGLLKDNFGTVFVAFLIYALIEGAIVGLGMIPFIGPLFSLANLVIVGPLMGGLFYVFIQAIRKQPTNAGDVFAGFQKAFLQLFLGHLVQMILIGLCVIPALIVLAIGMISAGTAAHHAGFHPGGHFPFPTGVLLTFLGVLLVCMIPMIYLQVNWMFTLPLIIDRRMDFWSAMKASWKMVNKHWWLLFGLTILIGLLNLGGLLLCCVGVVFTAPIGIGALMYAYETIFSEARAQAG